MPAHRRDSVAFTVLVTVLVLGGAVVMAAIVGLSGRPGTMALAVVLAALPVGPVVGCYMWLDRYEPEPRSLLFAGLAWGALVATAGALIFQGAGGVLGFTEDQSLYLVAPVTEELTKGVFLVLLLWWRRHELDGVLDGIVYAGLVGIGFAFVENILYFGSAFGEAGGAGAAGVFVLRGVFSPFAHSLFTMAIGVGLGLAASRRTPGARFVAPVAGLVVAIVLHAVWNLSALSGLQGWFSGYVLFQVPVFVAAVALALLARRREGRLIARHLGVYAAAGWLTPAEVAMLSRNADRRDARAWAARTMGPDAGRAMRDFQELASELAFLRERMAHGTAAADAGEVEQRLLATMWHLRPRFLPRTVQAGR